MADIEKTFLQIGIAEKDRDFVYFLWCEKENLTKNWKFIGARDFSLECVAVRFCWVLTAQRETS